MTDERAAPGRFYTRVLPALLLGLFVVLAAGSATWMSCTFDEPYHLTSGYAALRLGDFRFGPNHPPLARMWAALPAAVDPAVRFPTAEQAYRQGRQYSTSVWYCFVLNSFEQQLLRGRLMIVLLAAALGLLLYRSALRLYGVVAATASLTLFVFEPNLMAHGSLVTTDLGITLLFFLTALSLRAVCLRLTAARIAGLGLVFGLAQAAKFSALVLWPAAAAVLLGRALLARPWEVGAAGARRVAGRAGKTAAAAGVLLLLVAFSLAVVWGAYRLRYEMAPRPDLAFDTTEDPEFRVNDQAMGAALGAVRFLPEGYVRGAAQLLTWPQGRFFFAGRLRDRAAWYFYPAVLLLKTPTALLLLALTAAAFAARGRIRLPDAWPALAVPPAFLLLAGMASGVNTGVRHLLPVFPFLLLAAGAAVSALVASRRGRVLVAALGLLTLVEFTAAYPDVLAAFNLPSGGPRAGDRWLVGSDMDWGQGLEGLRRWMRQNGVEEINLACHTLLGDKELGFRTRRLPVYPDRRVRVDPPLLPGLVAVSASVLSGYTLGEGRLADFYAPLRGAKPVARVGNSIRVYAVEKPWWDGPLPAAAGAADAAERSMTVGDGREGVGAR